MKTCPNCQFECTDLDRFCGKCGMPFPENAAEEQPQAQEIPTFVNPDAEPKEEVPQGTVPQGTVPQGAAAPQAPTYQAPPRYMPPQSSGEEPVSTGKWILYHLIPCIPIVGAVVYIVMLFVWAFGNSENTTFRNWARSQLILSGIMLAIGLLLIILVVALGLGGLFAFGDMMDNGEFYYEYGY